MFESKEIYSMPRKWKSNEEREKEFHSIPSHVYLNISGFAASFFSAMKYFCFQNAVHFKETKTKRKKHEYQRFFYKNHKGIYHTNTLKERMLLSAPTLEYIFTDHFKCWLIRKCFEWKLTCDKSRWSPAMDWLGRRKSIEMPLIFSLTPISFHWTPRAEPCQETKTKIVNGEHAAWRKGSLNSEALRTTDEETREKCEHKHHQKLFQLWKNCETLASVLVKL